MTAQDNFASRFERIIAGQPTAKDLAAQEKSAVEQLRVAHAELGLYMDDGARALATTLGEAGITGDYFHLFNGYTFGYVIRNRKQYGSKDYPLVSHFKVWQRETDPDLPLPFRRMLIVRQDTGKIAIAGVQGRSTKAIINQTPLPGHWFNLAAFNSADQLPYFKSQIDQDLNAAVARYARGRAR